MVCMARNPIRSRRFTPYSLYGKKLFLKCAKIALIKQKRSGLENPCKNNFKTPQIKQGYRVTGFLTYNTKGVWVTFEPTLLYKGGLGHVRTHFTSSYQWMPPNDRGRMNPVSLKVTKFSFESSRGYQKITSFSILSLCDYEASLVPFYQTLHSHAPHFTAFPSRGTTRQPVHYSTRDERKCVMEDGGGIMESWLCRQSHIYYP